MIVLSPAELGNIDYTYYSYEMIYMIFTLRDNTVMITNAICITINL